MSPSEPFGTYVTAHKDAFIRELMALCRREDVAGRHGTMTETAEVIAARLRELGAEVKLLAVEGAPPVVYGEMGAGEKTLVIYNHYDVQTPGPLALWDSPPFEPDLRGGRLYARGVADNKGNIMARVQAVESWLATRGKLPLKIKWVIEGEEEVGSRHFPQWVDEHGDLLAGADGCLWEFGYKDGSGRQVLNLGVKGLLYVELRAHGAARDLHSSLAAIVPNPAWQLIWALGTLKDEKDHILIDGFMDLVAPPSDTARALLQTLPYDEEAAKADFEIPTFVRNLSGIALQEKLLFEPTCTICGLVAGHTEAGSKTILPNVATAKVDFRLVHDLEPEIALELLRKHLDNKGYGEIEAVPLAMIPPAQTDPAQPIVEVARAALQETCTQGVVVRPNSAGSSPLYLMTDVLDIPTVSFGVGHAGSNRHAPNENIRIADYLEGIHAINRFIERFAAHEF